MPLSNAEKQRRYRERKRAEAEARERYDKGLPPRAPEPEAPEGSYLTTVGIPHAKYDHYEALDGTFLPLPEAILQETYTTWQGEVVPLPNFEMKRRARNEPISSDLGVLWA